MHAYKSDSACGPTLVAFARLKRFVEFFPVMARSLDDVVSSVPDANRWKLDQEIDFEHRDTLNQVIPEHLGRIANSIMVDWETTVADYLGLTEADRSDIRKKNPREPKLQRY